MVLDYLRAVWSVLLELAPWLFVGAGVAGLLHGLLPPGFVHRALTGRGAVPKAVALGVPLPLCSCGVIPAGLGLKKDGASDGAAIAFLISTPQTGVDSILVSASFLGWPFALWKVGSAAITGLVGGWLTDALGGDAGGSAAPAAGGKRPGWRDMLEHGIEQIRSVAGWLTIGVLVSAAISTFVPTTWLSGLGGVAAPLAALAISVPLYVCATASVPIAAALVAGGLSASAALVFLMAGPATNVATIGAVYKTFGRRTTAVYLGTIVVGSLTLGLLFDQWLTVTATVGAHAHHGPVAALAASVLLALLSWFGVERIRMGHHDHAHGDVTELAVTGMHCGGCAGKVQRALMATDGVTDVQVDLEPGRVTIVGKAPRELLEQAVVAAGFGVGAHLGHDHH